MSVSRRPRPPWKPKWQRNMLRPTWKQRVKPILMVLVVAGLTALLLRHQSITTEAARRGHCRSKLCEIYLAIRAYSNHYGELPPSYTVNEKGERLLSWRVFILEFLDREHYRQFRLDEPWNSPCNKRASSRLPSVYSCPNSTDSRRNKLLTDYYLLTAKGTLYPTKDAIAQVRMADHGSAIILVESTTPEIAWTKPQDLSIDQIKSHLAKNDPHWIHSSERDGPGIVRVNGTIETLASPLLLLRPQAQESKTDE